MESVKLKGAILAIGSLAWENEKNAIDEKLGQKRQAWRESYLDMISSKKVNCPIRYGRKSGSRYNTFTMLFSNNTLINGTALLIPLSEEIEVSGSDFSGLYSQALNLSRVEGICKDNEDSLIAQWGTIGMKVSDKLMKENPSVYTSLVAYWKKYFSGSVQSERYRLGILENSSIDSNGFVEFDIEGSDDFDFILCTPVVPNMSEYPSASDIAQQMIASNYFTYFKENIAHGITTYMDEEVCSFLPESIASEIKIDKKPINFSVYPNNGGGLNQLPRDIRARLGKSIYAPSLEGLCFKVLKILDYPFEHKPGIHYDDIIRGIEQARQKFSEKFGDWEPYVNKANKGNPLKEFISLTLYLEESPGEIEEQLERKVLEDLRSINELVLYYETEDYIKTYLAKNVTPRNHDERILFDFYRRTLNERQNIINYLCNGIKPRAFQKAVVRDGMLGFALFDWYYDRPYRYAMPFSKGLFDYRNIDLVGHRLDRLSVTVGPHFRELYKTNRSGFYVGKYH